MRALQLTPEERRQHRLKQKNVSYHKNAVESNKRKKAARAANPDHARRLSREQSRRWKRDNHERSKDRYLKLKFGISLEEYNQLLEKQGGHCAIFPATAARPGDRYLSVDHDHATNRVRGLLCARHNMGIGYFQDSVDALNRAVAYLQAAA